MLPLLCSQELQRVGSKFQSTAKVRNQPILQRRFTNFPVRHRFERFGKLHTQCFYSGQLFTRFYHLLQASRLQFTNTSFYDGYSSLLIKTWICFQPAKILKMIIKSAYSSVHPATHPSVCLPPYMHMLGKNSLNCFLCLQLIAFPSDRAKSANIANKILALCVEMKLSFNASTCFKNHFPRCLKCFICSFSLNM